jgi:hypothetical protein
MGMSEAYGTPDWDSSVATIRRAIDLGVTFIAKRVLDVDLNAGGCQSGHF